MEIYIGEINKNKKKNRKDRHAKELIGQSIVSKTYPLFDSSHPTMYVCLLPTWYSMLGSLREFLQMAHVSAQMSQLHIVTAFHSVWEGGR